MERADFTYGPKTRELAAEAPEIYDEFARLDYRGNMNSTLIRTVKGRTILLQHDAHTQWSATHRSQAMDVPDFTAGAWQTNPRNMDIDLANGGGDTRILPPSKAAMDFDDELARQWARDHA